MPTPFPAPANAVVLELPTWSLPPDADIGGLVCLHEAIPPVRPVVIDGGVQFAVLSADEQPTSEVRRLIFPPGYAAWEQRGRIEVVSPAGRVAGEADGVLANLSGAADAVCRIDGVVPFPAGGR